MRPAIAHPASAPLLSRFTARVSPALAKAAHLPRRLIHGLEDYHQECREPKCHKPAYPGGYCVACWHKLYGSSRWKSMSADRKTWTREVH